MLPDTPGFRHEALFYSGDDEFLAGTVPFTRDAVVSGEPILVAVGAERRRALEAELQGEALSVLFADMEQLGRNPARIISAWRDFVGDQGSDGRSVRCIGEPIWPGRSAVEVHECHQHELLLNRAFADAASFWLLCPYDADGLEDEVLAGAERSHPFVVERSSTRASTDYVTPDLAPSPFEGELPPPTSSVPAELDFDGDGLQRLRMFIADCAATAGLHADRTEDLVLATSELAANSVRHAGGRGTLRVWREREALVCEVCDGGIFTEPLVGRARPMPEQPGGRGLWMVNELCDLVQIRSFPNENVVRLHMQVP